MCYYLNVHFQGQRVKCGGKGNINTNMKLKCIMEATYVNCKRYTKTKTRKYIQLGAQFCLIYLFMSLHYMFRASTCPSSGENSVPMQQWHLSLCMGGVWFAGWI